MNESISKEERTWGMLCHLIAFAGLLIPFGNIIGPLVVWLIRKDQMPFVDHNGKESLNFQISVAIYMIASAILALILIGFVLMTIVGIFEVVMIIIASIKANEGEEYKYPLTIRFIK